LDRFDRSFVNFFEDEMVHQGYDWREVMTEYLFAGEEPMFGSIMASRMLSCFSNTSFSAHADFQLVGLPLIHLAYAFELNSREIAMEALGLAATCHNTIYKSLETTEQLKTEGSYESKSLFEIIDLIRNDKALDGLFSTPGNDNLSSLLVSRNATFVKHSNAWNIENPVEQFRESQQLAAALLVGTTTADAAGQYDWFFASALATSHAVRVTLPFIPAQFQLGLIRQWWLVTVGIYIAQLRPEIQTDQIRDYDLDGKDWDWVADRAVNGPSSSDVTFVKTTRALREMASTWGDSDSFFLKAAVRFATEFKGWRGNFVGYEP
jgi:hypothetical protein